MTRNLESLEIIDTQIHEPCPGLPLDESLQDHTSLLQVELAREAMDAVGVDIAFAVTSERFIDLAHQRYPGRFPGVHTFWHTHPDLAAEVRRIAAHPAMIAGRALVGDFVTARMRPEFAAGVFEPLYAAAAEVGLPIFNSTHGGCAHLAAIAARYPQLTLIVDHIGVAQHPVSPRETMSWAPFEDLLALAEYPNVYVKLCGAPLLSQQNYPYEDLWPNLNRMFRAFGCERVMWGSDYTRLRSADLPRGERPRRRGITYAENLNYLLHSTHLTYEQKALVLGGNARRVFELPPISQGWGPPPMSWAKTR
ncbi:MAG TPA: amidohydrolase family protein [Steroidobacteraceae bacterium]|jgi:L-fuconolactonase|nr:amidohydrolase family protein [Steroidobacteraceae bacterium]